MELSKREFEVSQLVAEGLRNKEISIRIGIAEKTVKWYLTKAFQKLNVKTRTQLALKMLEKSA